MIIFKLKIPPLFFNSKSYTQDMATHSDFRKFDDMLRLILDCTEDQAQRIDEFLMEQHERGNLVFGLYRSQTALMTCFVESVKPGGHVHFIDGGDGGYAMASRQLKDQLKNQNK